MFHWYTGNFRRHERYPHSPPEPQGTTQGGDGGGHLPTHHLSNPTCCAKVPNDPMGNGSQVMVSDGASTCSTCGITKTWHLELTDFWTSSWPCGLQCDPLPRFSFLTLHSLSNLVPLPSCFQLVMRHSQLVDDLLCQEHPQQALVAAQQIFIQNNPQQSFSCTTARRGKRQMEQQGPPTWLREKVPDDTLLQVKFSVIISISDCVSSLVWCDLTVSGSLSPFYLCLF